MEDMICPKIWGGSVKDGQDLSIDEATFNELKVQYIDLIYSWIHKACYKFKFERRGVSRADLLQVCYVLLILAYKNHNKDHEGGAKKLSTVLVTYIKNAFLSIARKVHVERSINITDFHIKSSNYEFPLRIKDPLYDDWREKSETAIQSLYNDGKLNTRDIQIYRMMASGMDQIEIVGYIGTTKQRVSQLLEKIVKKIQRRVRLLEQE
jgi:DNA-directed RNA polymerase specialized sigma subunit